MGYKELIGNALGEKGEGKMKTRKRKVGGEDGEGQF